MGPNEQDQQFTELRQVYTYRCMGLYIQKLVLLRGLLSLDGVHELFVEEKGTIKGSQF